MSEIVFCTERRQRIQSVVCVTVSVLHWRFYFYPKLCMNWSKRPVEQRKVQFVEPVMSSEVWHHHNVIILGDITSWKSAQTGKVHFSENCSWAVSFEQTTPDSCPRVFIRLVVRDQLRLKTGLSVRQWTHQSAGRTVSHTKSHDASCVAVKTLAEDSGSTVYMGCDLILG